MRSALIWTAVALAMAVPIVAAGFSPYLAYRQPIYIVGGFSGIIGLSLLLLQPLLAAGALPALTPRRTRALHRAVGTGLIVLVVAHVAGLWITSPPDIIDALTFTSPTPFAAWGVIAMWALFASAAMAAGRRKLRLSPKRWRRLHQALGLVIVFGTILHAVLIVGAMEEITKFAICTLVAMATLIVVFRPILRRRASKV